MNEHWCTEAQKYLEEKGFTITNVYDDFFDFYGSAVNEKGETVASEGSMCFTDDDAIDYSVAYTIAGKELDGTTGSVFVDSDLYEAVDSIVAPVFVTLG